MPGGTFFFALVTAGRRPSLTTPPAREALRTALADAAFIRLCDYIHYNPVRHGYARCPQLWPYSSFARFVRDGRYDSTWNCTRPRPRRPPDYGDVEAFVGQ